MSLVELENVQRVYQMGHSKIYALKNISLKLESGNLVVCLGPSGSGKTTLLNVLGGIDKCEGKICIAGKEITRFGKRKLSRFRRKHVGFIFQFFNLLPVYSALENVEYAVELSQKRSRNETRLKAEEYLKAVGLYEKKDMFPSQLSGGEQQRVAAARALAKEPKLLLCDEPTGELSVKEGRLVLATIQKLVRTRPDTLTVLVTHNRKISEIADLVISLRSGTIDSITPQKPVDAMEITW
ncbi:MAG: ABC transporter ATP-binding protein [Candidatus Heimdallarchaeota archaeon]|nr:ABC transporter ATP-binding protein [Candidatus Heimdallarchaeota archaeon]